MNIFVTDEDPIQAAQELCDQHCRSKMQIESAILLQHCFDNKTLLEAPPTKKGEARKSGKGYYNHPCAAWVRESKANFEWLIVHTLEMFKERDFRWPSSDAHFTKTFIEWCKDNVHKTSACKETKLTPFAVAISEDKKCRKIIKEFDSLPVTEKYRLYIKNDKPFATWTVRKHPDWY